MQPMKFRHFLILILTMSASVIMAQNNWNVDYNKAMAKAKVEKKPVLVLFTGSDWCPPCHILESRIFESKKFEDYAKDNLILVMADFPKRKQNQLSIEQQQKNNKLAVKFGIRGFPTVLLLDTNGKVLDKKVGFGGETPEQYIQNIKNKTKDIK